MSTLVPDLSVVDIDLENTFHCFQDISFSSSPICESSSICSVYHCFLSMFFLDFIVYIISSNQTQTWPIPCLISSIAYLSQTTILIIIIIIVISFHYETVAKALTWKIHLLGSQVFSAFFHPIALPHDHALCQQADKGFSVAQQSNVIQEMTEEPSIVKMHHRFIQNTLQTINK